MSHATDTNTRIPSRRTIMIGIAAAPALAAPALALSAGPDPIFAAIERHRAAGEAFDATVDEQAELGGRGRTNG